jgi:hypothetical protein
MNKIMQNFHFSFFYRFAILFGFLSIFHPFFGQFNLPDVTKLDTYQKKEEFLLDLFRLDQHFRIEEMEIAGSTDKEKVSENLKNWLKADSICREQTAQYINLYGYPSGDSLSSLAKTAPLWVILHAVSELSYFFKYFNVLNHAYKNQAFSESDFDFYLCRALFVIQNVDYVNCGVMSMDKKIKKVKKISRSYVNKE